MKIDCIRDLEGKYYISIVKDELNLPIVAHIINTDSKEEVWCQEFMLRFQEEKLKVDSIIRPLYPTILCMLNNYFFTNYGHSIYKNAPVNQGAYIIVSKNIETPSRVIFTPNEDYCIKIYTTDQEVPIRVEVEQTYPSQIVLSLSVKGFGFDNIASVRTILLEFNELTEVMLDAGEDIASALINYLSIHRINVIIPGYQDMLLCENQTYFKIIPNGGTIDDESLEQENVVSQLYIDIAQPKEPHQYILARADSGYEEPHQSSIDCSYNLFASDIDTVPAIGLIDFNDLRE